VISDAEFRVNCLPVTELSYCWRTLLVYLCVNERHYILIVIYWFWF